MPTTTVVARCFKTPKTPEQMEEELRSHERRKALVSALPLHKGWPHMPLRSYQGFWFPEWVLPGVMALQDRFKPDPTDIFLVTYPKSGTTWLKALAFAISDRSGNRHPCSQQHPLLHRHPQACSPHLEGLFSNGQASNLDALRSPRIFGTHIPYTSLPESVRASGCRIVYLCRDPKDTMVSLWHFSETFRAAGTDQISFAHAMELFCNGQVLYGPVWEHLLGYWEESRRRPGEVMFLRYEEIMEDPAGCVRKMAEFMGHPFTEAEERDGVAEEIVRLCSFERLSGLKVNKVGVVELGVECAMKSSAFFRKGKVGDWREHLSPEMAARLDFITQKKLKGSGLSFSQLKIQE